MELIGENEYVRTDRGNIGKYKDFFNNYFEVIIKNSQNIIDIIECGDYVNGKEVVYDASEGELYNGHKTIGVSISNDNSTTWTILDTEIRDIVTKQQFNQMKYIVGDE